MSRAARVSTTGALRRPNMPPRNPWLADSVYPISHANPGATDSVLIAGPTVGKQLTREDALSVPNVMVSNPTIKKIGKDTVAFASGTLGLLKLLLTGKVLEALSFTPYPGLEREAQKATADAIESLVQDWDAARRARDDARLLGAISHMEGLGVNFHTGINGICNLFDCDGFHYCAYGGTKLLKSADDNVAREPVHVVASVDVAAAMPPQAAKAVTRIIGLSMTYDGFLAAASPGAVVILDRDLELKSFAAFLDEAVGNAIAVDEKGGIYVATSRRILKLVWNGETLSSDEKRGAWACGLEWTADEEALEPGSISRSAPPSLMGFGDDPDKLVVIAGGNGTGTTLVALWRDEIPEDFEQKPGTESRRVAGKIRIDISERAIEPSPCVLGYGMAVMNGTYPRPFQAPGISNAFTAGITRPAPRGIEKFTWDPQARQFHKAWINPAIDNSDIMVPVVSAATGMLYAAHKHDGVYQCVGLDWLTGETRARWIFPTDSCVWNAFGGIAAILENGDLLIGGAFAIKRIVA